MDLLEIAKIQNTINEIQNYLSKTHHYDNASVLMERASYQIKSLLVRIGYLESLLNQKGTNHE